MVEEWRQKLEKAALINKMKHQPPKMVQPSMYEPQMPDMQTTAGHTHTDFEDVGCRCDEEGSLWKRLLE